MSLLLFLVAAPAVFTVTVWVTVSVFRIVRPDEHSAVSVDAMLVGSRTFARRDVVAVPADPDSMSARDLWREFHHADYEYGSSAGIPDAWLDNILLRRN